MMMTSLRVGLALLLVVVASEPSRHPRQLNAVHQDTPNVATEQTPVSELLMTTGDLVRKHGYPLETHTVTTEDGYLLAVHRIPGSPRAAASPSGVKAPVLLQHGMGMGSDSWVLMGPEKGLGFILADEGYDVWMGNARGNHYSRKHATLSSRDVSFYNYTWHEMGVFDLPAVIDYVLATTNHSKLFYVGHSMGTTMFFVLTSTMPEYNQKIRLMVAMAPGVYLAKKTPSLLNFGAYLTRPFYASFTKANVGALGMQVGIPFARLVYALCADGKPLQYFCLQVYFSAFGYNRKELNTTMLPSIITHGVAAGNSFHVINHYVQTILTDRFQRYDRSGRMFTPQPEYDLMKISAPVSLHYGLNDVIIPPEGVIRLSQRLPNLVKLVQIPDARATHNDFVYAIHARELIYNQVLDLMRKF